MSYKLNKKLSDLVPYEPVAGSYEVRMDVNESCYNLDPRITDKIAGALKTVEFNRYPDPLAKDAVSAFASYYNLDESNVTAGNGSDELISIITSCFLEKTDTIVTLSPDFSMYAFYSSLYELDVKVFEKEDDLTVNIEKLILYCRRNNAKALILSNPCNPTSLGIPKPEILKIPGSLDDCLVIIDEAYMDFWDESILDSIDNYSNLIVLKTCSKFAGLAAVRLGFAVAGKTVTNALRAAKSPYNADAIAQLTGRIVFSDREYLDDMKKKIIENTKYLYNEMLRINEKLLIFDKIYDTKANFLFIKTCYAEEIFRHLLENSIAVRKFGGHLRICAGTKKEIEKLVSAIYCLTFL